MLKEKHKWSDENRHSIMPGDYEEFISLTLKDKWVQSVARLMISIQNLRVSWKSMNPPECVWNVRGSFSARVQGDHSICGAVEDVQCVFTLFGRGKAQVFHDPREEELKEQLEVEEEDGDRQEEKVEEKGEASQGECAMDGMKMTVECAQNLSHEVSDVYHRKRLWTMRDMCRLNACCAPLNRRSRRRHWCTCCACCPACCTRRSSFTFDAVVHRTLVLLAIFRNHCFHSGIFSVGFCCIGGIVFTHAVGDSRLPSAVTAFWTVLQQINSENRTSNEYPDHFSIRFPWSISAGYVFVVMLIRRIPPGFLPVPPRRGIVLPSLLMSCILFVFELSKGWQCLLEVKSMPNWHRIGTKFVWTNPPIVSVHTNFFSS